MKQYDISKPQIESVVFSLVEKSADLPIDLEFDNLKLDELTFNEIHQNVLGFLSNFGL